RLVAPMIRGSHFRNYHHWIAVHHGRAAADKTLIEAGVDPALIHADRWYPLRSALDVLEHVETRFGDGTYETVRRMMRDEAINFTSLRRFVKRVIPFPILLELSPNSYAREFNHGRLEVDVEDHRAVFRNYDWMSSPARCAAWLGTSKVPSPCSGLPEPSRRSRASSAATPTAATGSTGERDRRQ